MRIQAPEFELDDLGTPRATAFEDIYFHPASGLDETRHVFLEGNRLPERLAALPDHGRFAIGELGLGTGLNVLAVCQLFESVAPKTARLSIVSVEGFPMPGAVMDQQLAAFPELDPWRQRLRLTDWLRVGGVQRFPIGDRVDLTVFLGGVEDALGEMTQPVDAWFLDGFAPSRNPDMWSEAILARVGALTQPGGTAATFTAAGFVRRGLKAAGFDVKKIQGFGGKRDMTVAEMPPPPEGGAMGGSIGMDGGQVGEVSADDATPLPESPPPNLPLKGEGSRQKTSPETPCSCVSNPSPLRGRPGGGDFGNECKLAYKAPQKHILIIGAGWAGCAAADALARRGHRVTLLEKHTLAAGASGNPQAVLEPMETVDDTPRSAWHTAAFLHARRWLQQHGLLHASGILRKAAGHKDNAWLKRAAEHANWLDGVPVWSEALEGLQLPVGGWADPLAVCQQMIHHANITLVEHTTVKGFKQTQSADGQTIWQVDAEPTDSNRKPGPLHTTQASPTLQADAIVLANAWSASHLPGCEHWPLQPVRGQLTCPRATDASQQQTHVLCGKGYGLPAFRGRHAVGASFGPNDLDASIRPQDNADNQAKLQALDPDLANAMDWQDVRCRVSFRCSTPDRMPVVGWLPPPPEGVASAASSNRRPGLALTLGHGSRGLMGALLAAEVLADGLDNSPPPIGQSALAAVAPERFAQRLLKKGQLDPNDASQWPFVWSDPWQA